MMKEFKVAVYGSLRKTLGSSELLKESEYLGKEWTDGGYKMVSLGGFPGVFLEENGGKIKIEVYKINEYTLARLNMLEGFIEEDNPGNFYNRKTINTTHGIAYIYYIDKKYITNPVVENGDWTEYYLRNKKYQNE